MDEELKKEVQRFVISYMKLYADEFEFLSSIVKHNKDAFDSWDSLSFYIQQLSTNIKLVMDDHFDKETIENVDKAHFVVTIDEDPR